MVCVMLYVLPGAITCCIHSFWSCCAGLGLVLAAGVPLRAGAGRGGVLRFPSDTPGLPRPLVGERVRGELRCLVPGRRCGAGAQATVLVGSV